jgi:hypothetical protein
VDTRPLNKLLWWCNLALRLAGWIVPQRRRLEWRREWEAEVWHRCHFLVESGQLSVSTEHDLLRHCCGAFPDALWHRFNRAAVLEFRCSYPLTPGFCLVVSLAVLSVLIAASPMPLSWWRLSPRLDVQSAHLVTVSLNWRANWLEPEMLRDAVARWRGSCPLIAEAGTYAWRRSLVQGPAGKEELLTARVTPGIFALLGTRPILGRTFEPSDFSACASCVVLSNSIWRSQFHQSKHVVGKRLSLNGRQVSIIGVLPEQFGLPGLDIGLYAPFGMGFQPRQPNLEWPGAILRLSEDVPVGKAKRELDSFVNKTDHLASNTILDVLTQRDMQYQSLESCAVLIPLVIPFLIILNWCPIVRLCTTGPRRMAAGLFRWWLFFAAKSILLTLIVGVASLDVAQMKVLRFGVDALDYAGGTATWLCLVGLTIVLSWSVRDQLSRCRRCLDRLRIRVDLGMSVGTFGEPGGVELVCNGGHGALHLPVMHSGSLDSERWADLDESWRTLTTVAVGVRT